MRATPDQQLTLEALAMAVRQRRVRPGLIHHSDQGAQYSCVAYQQQLATLGMTPSMSRKGNCYDNAVAESFFSTLKNDSSITRRITRGTKLAGRSSRSSKGFIIASASIRASRTSVRWSSSDGSMILNLVSTKPGPAQCDPFLW
jgi:transposase InsO family protein